MASAFNEKLGSLQNASSNGLRQIDYYEELLWIQIVLSRFVDNAQLPMF